MQLIKNQSFDGERSFYARHDLCVVNCRNDGARDGESAFKECVDIYAENCFFNLRYPFWHNNTLEIKNCEMTPLCRAAIWYSGNIKISGTKMHGIKALRECCNIEITECDIVSPEFGWSAKSVSAKDTCAESEYFFLRGENLNFSGVRLNGKYSFQYVSNSTFFNCIFNTKDAFWHSKNVTVKDCEIKGEYLAWYSENLTLKNCRISGTQPFCYCKGLRLINCEMTDTDLCFEKSDVMATITTGIISIKNPRSGSITAPYLGELIRDDSNSECEISIKTNGDKKNNE